MPKPRRYYIIDRKQDIDAIYRLWNFYRYVGSAYKKDWMEMGVPQSLGYLGRRLGVGMKDLDIRSLEVSGCQMFGVEGINPDNYFKG